MNNIIGYVLKLLRIQKEREQRRYFFLLLFFILPPFSSSSVFYPHAPPPFPSSSSSFIKNKEFWFNHTTAKCFGSSEERDIMLGEVTFELNPQRGVVYQGEEWPR